MNLRFVLAFLCAPLVVPAYVLVVSSGGKAFDLLILAVVAQAITCVIGFVVALMGWRPSAVQAAMLGAGVGAAIASTLGLVWKEPDLWSAVVVLLGLGAAVGFLYWVIAWWSPVLSKRH